MNKLNKIFPYLMLATAFSSPFWKWKKDELENIDIEKEYKLIQSKKSVLPRRLRDMVEWKYNKLKEQHHEQN